MTVALEVERLTAASNAVCKRRIYNSKLANKEVSCILTILLIDRSIEDVKKAGLEDKRPRLQDLAKPKSFLGKVTRLV